MTNQQQPPSQPPKTQPVTHATPQQAPANKLNTDKQNTPHPSVSRQKKPEFKATTPAASKPNLEAEVSKTAKKAASPSTSEITVPPLEKQPSISAIIHKRIARPPKIRANSIVFTVVLFSLAIVASFTDVTMPFLNLYFEGFFNGNTPSLSTLPVIDVNGQLAFMLFIGALMGPALGGLAMVTLILSGVFLLPLFQQGVGISYLSTPGFIYLAGLTTATITAGRLGFWAFQNPRENCPAYSHFGGLLHPSLWKIPVYAGILVLMVHGIGLLGLKGFQIATPELSSQWQLYMTTLTLHRLAYDIIFTTFAMTLVRPIRALLWPVLY